MNELKTYLFSEFNKLKTNQIVELNSNRYEIIERRLYQNLIFGCIRYIDVKCDGNIFTVNDLFLNNSKLNNENVYGISIYFRSHINKEIFNHILISKYGDIVNIIDKDVDVKELNNELIKAMIDVFQKDIKILD